MLIIPLDANKLSLEITMFCCDICPRLCILLNLINSNNIAESYIIYNSLFGYEVKDKLKSISKKCGFILKKEGYLDTWYSYLYSFINKPDCAEITYEINNILLLLNLLPKEVPSSTDYYYIQVIQKISVHYRTLLNLSMNMLKYKLN